MKGVLRCTSVVGALLALALWLCSPITVSAGDFIDLTSIPIEDVASVLGKKFDALEPNGDKWDDDEDDRRKCPDPNDFEFLLKLEVQYVDATANLPAFWQVTGRLFSDIKFELRLPPKNEWNKKFYMAGCGGFCGGVDTGFPNGQFTNNLNWGLLRGYAAATTDSGHDNMGLGRTYAGWALDNRSGEIDWGYRSIHEVTRVCKALICLFYHRQAKYSYFAGCSTGGRQAIMEALRFPKDFDGVISGAPALDYTGLVATWMSWVVQGVDGNMFSAADQENIRTTVLDQCDALDGAADGLISDPTRCPVIDFSDAGLSPGQLAALNQIYNPVL